MSNKIGVIGARHEVQAYRAVGLNVVAVASAEEAARTVFQMAQDNYSVIFITEEQAKLIPDTLQRYKSQPLPAIIPIPGSQGSSGFAMKLLRDNVEKAVGVDILFQKEG